MEPQLGEDYDPFGIQVKGNQSSRTWETDELLFIEGWLSILESKLRIVCSREMAIGEPVLVERGSFRNRKCRATYFSI